MKTFYPKKQLSKESKGEQVLAELRMRIISREVEAGTVLSENQLGALFDVSRSPVREALRVLASENLVRSERMGAVVVGISEKNIEEIYDVRLMVESFTFERLLKMQTDALVQELRKTLEMMEIAIKYKDVDQFSFLDLEFHETVIKYIDHHHIMMLWTNLRPVLECLIILSMRYRMITDEKDFERVLYNHELIVEAIDKKEKNLVDLAFERNFHDVHNQVEPIWTDEEMMKTVREYSVKE